MLTQRHEHSTPGNLVLTIPLVDMSKVPRLLQKDLRPIFENFCANVHKALFEILALIRKSPGMRREKNVVSFCFKVGSIVASIVEGHPSLLSEVDGWLRRLNRQGTDRRGMLLVRSLDCAVKPLREKQLVVPRGLFDDVVG